MVAAEKAEKPNYRFRLEEFLAKDAPFDLRLDGKEDALGFLVSAVLGRDLFVGKLASGKHLPERITGRLAIATFAGENALCLVRVSIKGQSSNGTNVTIQIDGEPTYKQQRRHQRLKTDDTIIFRIQFDSNGNIYRGIKIEDISEGGLGVLIHTAGEIEKGTRARILIELAKREPIIILGEVTNCSKPGKSSRVYRIGIRFIDVKKEDLLYIANYVNRHSKLNRLRSNIHRGSA
ncbi:MAG: PilZ domain-containing protein [Firmicutes bacterium]|nr:PilZ domain-containing protein [Bacillota bacterium]